ncbi:MAG: hypothetical protein ACR2QF_01765 [Geminicoccaceae bacterium]
MLAELNQLLACRREREDRAAQALRRARALHEEAKTALVDLDAKLEVHHQQRLTRQNQLYKQSLRSRLTHHQIDDLNIELDLMEEETDILIRKIREAEAKIEAAGNEVDEAAAVYRKHRQAGDRWKHLVDDVADFERRERDQAEEFALEDDIGDRRTTPVDGAW